MPTRIALFLFALISLRAADLIAKHPQQDLIFQSLQRLVDNRATVSENHFFLVRRKDGQDWVYWQEGRKVWRTDLTPYCEKKGAAELRARAVWGLRLSDPWRAIELDTDVVAKLESADQWTNHVTQEVAAALIHDCVTDGELIMLKKKVLNHFPQNFLRAAAMITEEPNSTEPTPTSVPAPFGTRAAPAVGAVDRNARQSND